MATQIPQIENYIRKIIANNGGSFNREAILKQSQEWMEKFPVEFNSVLNMIEAEGRNVGCDEMMDDSTPSVAYGSRFADDSTPSVAFGSRYDDDIPSSSVAYGGYADDSMPSVAYGGYADDSTPSVAPYHDEYSGNIAPDHMSSVSDSPMASDHIGSSPGGYPDDDFESDMPLQRTMSSYTPSRR
jgi:hypothetical protein